MMAQMLKNPSRVNNVLIASRPCSSSGAITYNDNKQKQSARRIEEAAIAARTEAFHRFMQQGIGALKAHQHAENVYKESMDKFTRMASDQARQSQQIPESDQQLIELIELSKETISKEINRKEFAKNYSRKEAEEQQRDYLRQRKHILARNRENFDRAYKCVFSTPSSDSRPSLIDQPVEDLKKRPLEFWRQWDERRAQILSQSLGPRNLLEEQIEWTKKGMMWPYPIDNEYMAGEEEKVSFVDHIFLEPELAKHNLPRSSKAVTHFMELVLVGLSKNPYMSVEKKYEHIRWYADYFKDVMSGKYKELL